MENLPANKMIVDDVREDAGIPLVVDLDGTLIKTDLLFEGIVMLFRKNPLYIFRCLLWMLKGKAYFKNKVFNIVEIKVELLPYNEELLGFLKAQSLKRRKLILATASLQLDALRIAELHPIFGEVYGTDINVNLKGIKKSEALKKEYTQFDYIGNSHSDIKIFESSRFSYLVNPSKSLEKKTKKISNLKYVWRTKKSSLKDYVKAIRVYQWLKNFLIFVPLITSHSFFSLATILPTIAAFFAFSFIASAGYVINDLLDLNADRIHPRKRLRPFASGKLSIITGTFLAVILLSGGMLLAASLNVLFLITAVLYFIISFSYSLYFKRIVLYDVFILALLYSTRVIAGGVVTNIPISFWLIAFSTFMFLSLAFVKRYSELMKISDKAGLEDRGREYNSGDLNLLQIMGIVSGFLSVVVFSLYIDSPDVSVLYAHPKILWVISLLFLFWISRIWIITNRGDMTDDPIIFAIKDVSSYFIFSLVGLIIWISM